MILFLTALNEHPLAFEYVSNKFDNSFYTKEGMFRLEPLVKSEYIPTTSYFNWVVKQLQAEKNREHWGIAEESANLDVLSSEKLGEILHESGQNLSGKRYRILRADEQTSKK